MQGAPAWPPDGPPPSDTADRHAVSQLQGDPSPAAGRMESRLSLRPTLRGSSPSPTGVTEAGRGWTDGEERQRIVKREGSGYA